MSDRWPILADCPQHGRVQHHYYSSPNAWFCRTKGCRHFITDEEATKRVDPPGCRCTDCILGASRPASVEEWTCESGLLGLSECFTPGDCEDHDPRTALRELLDDMEAVNGPLTEAEMAQALRRWPA